MDNPDVFKATRREWIGLAVISLPCLMYSMDVTVLNLAVPRISAELRPSSSQLLWIVDIYGFLLSGLLIPMGTLGDRIGRRRLLLMGAAAFGTASVLAALSRSTAMLIGARALLGVAGATLAPSTLSLIRHMFADTSQRTFAIGVWTASFSVGAAIGPMVGGLVLQYFSWGAVFLISVPVMALLLALGPVLLPEFDNPTASRMDLFSAFQSLAATLLVIYGVKQLATYGWQWSDAIYMAAGASAGAAFVRRQGRLEHPLIDFGLLRTTAFTAALLAYTFGCFVTFGIYLFIAQYLQLVLGLSPLRAGLCTLPATLGLAIGSVLTPALLRRAAPAITMSAGLMLAVGGLAMISQVERASNVSILVSGLFVLYLGLAPVFIPAIDLMVGTVPPERAGEVSAIAETGSELGAALGVAILGSVGAAVYRNAVTNTIPAGLSPEAAQAARNTLGGAFAVARQLPDDLGVALQSAAHAAFDRSFHLAAVLSAAFLFLMAMVVMVLTRARPFVLPSQPRTTRLDDIGG